MKRESNSPSRLKWIVGQLGPKTGAKRSQAMLLLPSNLGPGWRMVDERTWRSGLGDDGAALRAREAGGITAWRSFATDDKSRWLWCQVIPLASESDAVETLSRLDEMFLRNVRAKVEVVSEREVHPPEIAGADQTWGFEQETVAKDGSALALYLGLRVASVVAVMCASGAGTSWSQLARLGSDQIRRVQEAGEGQG